MFTKLFTRTSQKEYQDIFAPEYRKGDTTEVHHPEVRYLANRLSALTNQSPTPGRVLEIGCGAGRYFHAVKNTYELVGIDISENMIAQAHHPVLENQIEAKKITLEAVDFFDYRSAEPFDILYSFGVLGEHTPFNDAVAERAYVLLKDQGFFMVTVINPFGSLGYFIKQCIKKLFRTLGIATRYRFMNTSAFGLNTMYGIRRILHRNKFRVISIESVQKSHPHYLLLAQKIT